MFVLNCELYRLGILLAIVCRLCGTVTDKVVNILWCRWFKNVKYGVFNLPHCVTILFSVK